MSATQAKSIHTIREDFNAPDKSPTTQVGQPAEALALEPIRRTGYTQVDPADVEDKVIRAVEVDPGYFMDRYKQDVRSFDGRYVAADLLKEPFEQFSASKETRNRYNTPVHNSAAVLSAAQSAKPLLIRRIRK